MPATLSDDPIWPQGIYSNDLTKSESWCEYNLKISKTSNLII